MASIVLQVNVKPRSRSASLEPLPDGTWVARVKAAPTGGRANQELIALVADRFHCPRSSVRVKTGASARRKLLEVERP